MEKEKRKEVVYLPEAEKNIAAIAQFISGEGYPETAIRFADSLYDFGDALGFLPEKFPACRHKEFRRRGYRCAVYSGNYIFIYKIVLTKIYIVSVVHSASLK